MAVNNKAGGIIVKHFVGKCPVIYLNDTNKRYELSMTVNNSAYAQIIKDCELAGLEIRRSDIDDFLNCIYDFKKAYRPVYTDDLSDDEVLAGERLRLNGLNGRYADLLKVRKCEYLCTDGVCAGQILTMSPDAINVNKYINDFALTSMELLPPTEAHYLLDYRYLNSHRTNVTESIEELYRAVSLAFLDGTLSASFMDILQLCGKLGQSTWTLRGIIDFLCLKNQK